MALHRREFGAFGAFRADQMFKQDVSDETSAAGPIRERERERRK